MAGPAQGQPASGDTGPRSRGQERRPSRKAGPRPGTGPERRDEAGGQLASRSWRGSGSPSSGVERIREGLGAWAPGLGGLGRCASRSRPHRHSQVSGSPVSRAPWSCQAGGSPHSLTASSPTPDNGDCADPHLTEAETEAQRMGWPGACHCSRSLLPPCGQGLTGLTWGGEGRPLPATM